MAASQFQLKKGLTPKNHLIYGYRVGYFTESDLMVS